MKSGDYIIIKNVTFLDSGKTTTGLEMNAQYLTTISGRVWAEINKRLCSASPDDIVVEFVPQDPIAEGEELIRMGVSYLQYAWVFNNDEGDLQYTKLLDDNGDSVKAPHSYAVIWAENIVNNTYYHESGIYRLNLRTLEEKRIGSAWLTSPEFEEALDE